MNMRCAAVTATLDPCSRHPLPYGDYCRQHQQMLPCALLSNGDYPNYHGGPCLAVAAPGHEVCETHMEFALDPDGTCWPFLSAPRKDNAADRRWISRGWRSPDGHPRWGCYSCVVVACVDTDADVRLGRRMALGRMSGRVREWEWEVKQQRTRTYRGLPGDWALAVVEVLIEQPPVYVVCWDEEVGGSPCHKHGPWPSYEDAHAYRHMLQHSHHGHCTSLLPSDELLDVKIPSA